jgi:hypothetical protein
MQTLHVSRLRARYRLPAAQQALRARLDRVLRDVLSEALEVALHRAGVAPHEEACIRRVHVPIRLRMGLADPSLAAAWSLALAEAIHDVIARGGADVVRYGSRPQALIDQLIGVATGNLHRSWAWRQLGLWRAGDDASPLTAAAAAARALTTSPESIVAVLAAAARAGPLPVLLRRLPPDAWTILARAALAAAYAAPADAILLIEDATTEPTATPGRSMLPRADRVLVLAERVVRTSVLLEAAAGVQALEPLQRRALAVLAVLEVEPTALREPTAAAALVAEVERHLGRPANTLTGETQYNAQHRSPDRSNARHTRGREQGEPAAPSGAPDNVVRASLTDREGVLEGSRGSDDQPTERQQEAEGLANDDGSSTRQPTIAATFEQASAVAAPEPEPPEAGEGYPLFRVRRRGETRWAGLLFLLHVLTELKIPEEILASERLAPYPLRWVTHRLALSLAPLEADDPAALAFAGLAPDQPPPSGDEPDPALELEAVDAEVGLLARRVAARACERLRGEPCADAREAAALLRSLCRRRGGIVADPGWFEVHLSLDEVSTEVRRAGLDLDPGWIPWLGVVVRFVYE